MDKVRLGVLGAGNIAAMNVQGYLFDPRCEVVAVCDTDEVVGRLAAKDWGERLLPGPRRHAGRPLARRR